MTEPITPTDDSIRAAALKAMSDSGLSAENWPDDGTGESPEAQPEVTPPSEEPAPSSEAGQGNDEVPTEYYGIDLSDLPSEKRKEVINRLKEQDRYVQSVQQRAAELEKAGQQSPAPEPEAKTLSDDDIMASLGVSPDDPMYEVKKEMMLSTAKEVLTLKSELQEYVETQRIREFENHWNTTLDQLEEDHGKLPISRDELLQLAVDNNIFDPMDAYARVHLSGRKTLASELEKFKAAANQSLEDRKKPPATIQPHATDVAPVEKPELLNPTEAARRAAEKLGFDWGQTLNQMQS